VLLTAATIRQLANIIEAKNEIRPDLPLIPIKTSGDKSPLFFIPGKGGYPTRIRHLARKFTSDIPVYAFQNTLSEQTRSLPYTLEYVAEQYLNEIKKVHPQGTFTLVGESMGGIICYELAQQSIRFGYPPPLLVLLDTYIDKKSVPDQYRAHQRWQFYKMLIKKHTSIWFSSNWQGKKEYLEFYKETFFEKTKRFLARRVEKRLAKIPQIFPEKYKRIEQNNWRAGNAYVPKPYPAQVILVTASRGPESNYFAHGWDKVGIKELVIQNLDCYHGSILFEPAVSELAKIIQSHIK
jgi:thioesterase domain-containing protein